MTGTSDLISHCFRNILKPEPLATYNIKEQLENPSYMAVNIRSIHIENFRSIKLLDAPVSPLAVFVGKNDSGKSNILRALNLFFNEQTNHGTRFNFDEDYNFFAPERQRKAKEIVVKIDIEIPQTYHQTNGDVIVWEKRWRKEGLVKGDTNYYGVRLGQNNRGKETRQKVNIPEKSNVHALLRKIEFEYVPAVKDAKYFDDLRGRIYSIIAEVAARTFRTSSAAFEQSIGTHLEDLTGSIDSALGSETRLALPRDLSHIFEKLDFLSGEQSISLENRGDGIKARHIPLILKFMALKKVSLQVRGGMPSSFIWGYEEPENNLEFANAIELADELIGYANEGVAQILLTTHSPIFYDLAERDDTILMHHVSRQSDVEGTKVSKDNTGLDESLGTLAMIAPRISGVIKQVREQEKAKSEAAALIEQNRPKIFVEGESDAIIFRRAMELYFPEHVAAIDFQTKRQGAGHSYVIDMLVGWRSKHKHYPERPKAVGIVDGDADQQKNDFNRIPDNIKSAKCFCYPKPHHIRGALQSGFRLSVDLEALYRPEMWGWASENNHLEPRERRNIYPPGLIEQIMAGDVEPHTGLDDNWSIYVQFKFKLGSKIVCADHLAAKNDDDCYVELAPFESLLRDVLSYLGLIAEAE